MDEAKQNIPNSGSNSCGVTEISIKVCHFAYSAGPLEGDLEIKAVFISASVKLVAYPKMWSVNGHVKCITIPVHTCNTQAVQRETNVNI